MSSSKWNYDNLNDIRSYQKGLLFFSKKLYNQHYENSAQLVFDQGIKRGAAIGKTGKTTVLPRFCGLECSGGTPPSSQWYGGLTKIIGGAPEFNMFHLISDWWLEHWFMQLWYPTSFGSTQRSCRWRRDLQGIDGWRPRLQPPLYARPVCRWYR